MSRGSLALLLGCFFASPAQAQEDLGPAVDPQAEAPPETAEVAPDAEPDAVPGEAEARARFELATVHYREGRFLDAATEYEAAYRASQRPELLYNIYLSYRDANQPEDAARWLRRYLEEAPADIANREILEARLAALEADQSEDTTRITSSEDDGPNGLNVLPVVLLSVAGAATVGAVITGVAVLSIQSGLESKCLGGDCSGVDGALDDRDRMRTFATATDVLGGVAIVSLGVGLSLLLFSGGDDEAPVVACGVGACTGSWSF